MKKSTAQRVVSQTFKAAFDRDRPQFREGLTNGFDEAKKQTTQIPDMSANFSITAGQTAKPHSRRAGD